MLDYFVVTVAQILKFSDSTMETNISFFLLFRKFCLHDGAILENFTFTFPPWVSHCIFSFAGVLCFWFITFVTALLTLSFAFEPLRSHFASTICACRHQVAVESLSQVIDAAGFVDGAVRQAQSIH